MNEKCRSVVGLYFFICFSTLELIVVYKGSHCVLHWTPRIKADNITRILLHGEESNKEMSYVMMERAAHDPDSPDCQLQV